jgi:hypothetical protein
MMRPVGIDYYRGEFGVEKMQPRAVRLAMWIAEVFEDRPRRRGLVTLP